MKKEAKKKVGWKERKRGEKRKIIYNRGKERVKKKGEKKEKNEEKRKKRHK